MTKLTAPATRTARIATVNAWDIHINPAAQRDFREPWARHILDNWDDDKFQLPHVNEREDGSLYAMDGQHTVDAYRNRYGNEAQDPLGIQVWLYVGLTEKEEADFFLVFNGEKKAVDTMSRFKVAVTAGYPAESDIDRIVRANGCVVTSATATAGAISAVAALTSIYRRHGGNNLGLTIRTIRNSFGQGGHERANLIGLSDVYARYGASEEKMTEALLRYPRGSKGLIQRANVIREQFGTTSAEATSIAIVEQYNKGKRGRSKLPSWFSADEGEAA